MLSASTPRAQKIPHILSIHGDQRIDPYFWIHDITNASVMDYIESENAYTTQMMEHTEHSQAVLYKEMLSRLQEADFSFPYCQDNFYYYWRTETGKDYEIFCRKKGSLDAPEEILLDQNKLAEGHDYFQLDICQLSPDHKILAYSVDTTGLEQYTLNFLNLNTLENYTEQIEAVGSLAWKNETTCFYTQIENETNRPCKLFCHQIGESLDQDILLFYEQDPAYDLGVWKTRSRDYIIFECGNIKTSEIHYLSANSSENIFQMIAPRSESLYSVEPHGEHFYIITNEEAPNFKLIKAPITSPSKENWETVIPHREDVMIRWSVLAFADHLVIPERISGLPQLRIHQFSTQEDYYVDFPEPIYEIEEFLHERNREFNTSCLYFEYKSLVTPNSIYEYNMATRELTLKKQQEVLGDYDPSLYQSERVWAMASDGTQVPMSLVYKKGLERNSNTPLLLAGYGAYMGCEYIRFSAWRLSLLDRGVVFAVAHVRGGQELGRTWYEDGKLLRKMNTFTDFIACAEFLIAQGWTSQKKLAIWGESAGGLLVGAVMNLRPNLSYTAIARVPFVDVITSTLDTTLPLSVLDWDEWGNPNEKIYYDYIKSYSPYDNVQPQNYPHLLVTTSLNDSRVSCREPLKWVAKLRDIKTDDNRLILKVNLGAGHIGSSSRYKWVEEIAFEYAFLLDCWGIVV